jgi:short-subunit dehydrogenase
VAGAFEDLDTNDFKNMLHVNVLGSIYPTRVVLGGMKRKGKGRIVFVSSQA